MERTLAPKNRAWASLPIATFPEGRKTAHFIPALAAYAARAAEVFPVEAHPTTLAPSSLARETPMVMPRSLKEPVGLSPSNFTNELTTPTSAPRALVGYRGVPPSWMETLCAGSTGMNGAYLHTPMGTERRSSGFISLTGSRSILTVRRPPHLGQVLTNGSSTSAPQSQQITLCAAISDPPATGAGLRDPGIALHIVLRVHPPDALGYVLPFVGALVVE